MQNHVRATEWGLSDANGRDSPLITFHETAKPFRKTLFYSQRDCGLVTEVVPATMGTRLGSYITDNILHPLGMHRITHRLDDGNVAAAYAPRNDGSPRKITLLQNKRRRWSCWRIRGQIKRQRFPSFIPRLPPSQTGPGGNEAKSYARPAMHTYQYYRLPSYWRRY